jgi:hypothetical protein
MDPPFKRRQNHPLFSNLDKPEPMAQGKHGKNWVLLVILPWDWRSSLKFYTMRFVPVKMLSAQFMLFILDKCYASVQCDQANNKPSSISA